MRVNTGKRRRTSNRAVCLKRKNAQAISHASQEKKERKQRSYVSGEKNEQEIGHLYQAKNVQAIAIRLKRKKRKQPALRLRCLRFIWNVKYKCEYSH
ncbi:hypothetical protein A7K91_22265 [Paenibacillus oryzae]|uniref:Uncharacterized protein n=1 Tax=Paenibacillus oryzae TaxID=1844972 RepID=A0A1A5YPT0_9BACL|nr:hypothetical protein A7K91_22265 [Paenibacillus oryzae]